MHVQFSTHTKTKVHLSLVHHPKAFYVGDDVAGELDFSSIVKSCSLCFPIMVGAVQPAGLVLFGQEL